MIKVHFKTQNISYSGPGSCLSWVRHSKQSTVDLDTGCYLRTNWLFHMLVLSRQDYLPWVLTSLPRREIPPGLGRSGCKTGWFLLCSCLQFSVCRFTSRGSWATPSIHIYWYPPFPGSSFSADVWTFTHTRNYLLPIKKNPAPCIHRGVVLHTRMTI